MNNRYNDGSGADKLINGAKSTEWQKPDRQGGAGNGRVQERPCCHSVTAKMDIVHRLRLFCVHYNHNLLLPDKLLPVLQKRADVWSADMISLK